MSFRSSRNGHQNPEAVEQAELRYDTYSRIASSIERCYRKFVTLHIKKWSVGGLTDKEIQFLEEYTRVLERTIDLYIEIDVD